MNILFVTGGTGGHISAALSLAKEIRLANDKVNIKFLLNTNSVFENKLQNNKFNYKTYTLKISNSLLTFAWLSYILDNIRALVKSFFLIAEFKPDVLVGFGSYASIPAVLAGFLSFKKIAIILHEQNLVPGKANKLLSVAANKVAISFKESKKFFRNKAVYTGNFVDESFFTATKNEGIKELKLKQNKFTLLVMGGSQGAVFINGLFLRAIDFFEAEVKKNIQIIHICGTKNYKSIKDKYSSIEIIDYNIIGFSDNMPVVLAASDLIISRAGATSIAEINALGKPAILIPYPYAGNHQRFNAQVLEDSKAAIVFNERLVSEKILADTIISLMKDKERLKAMARASGKLADAESMSKMKQLIRQCYENIR